MFHYEVSFIYTHSVSRHYTASVYYYNNNNNNNNNNNDNNSIQSFVNLRENLTVQRPVSKEDQIMELKKQTHKQTKAKSRLFLSPK
jgi:hypothetical protein